MAERNRMPKKSCVSRSCQLAPGNTEEIVGSSGLARGTRVRTATRRGDVGWKIVVDDLHLALRHPVDAGDGVHGEAVPGRESRAASTTCAGATGDVEIVALERRSIGLDRPDRGAAGERRRRPMPWPGGGADQAPRIATVELLEGRVHSCSLATGKRRLPVSFSSSFKMPSISASGRGGQPGT